MRVVIIAFAALVAHGHFSNGEYLRRNNATKVINLENLHETSEVFDGIVDYVAVGGGSETTATDENRKVHLIAGFIPGVKVKAKTANRNNLGFSRPVTVYVENRTPYKINIWCRYSLDGGKQWQITNKSVVPRTQRAGVRLCETTISYVFLYAQSERCEWKDTSGTCRYKFNANGGVECFYRQNVGQKRSYTVVLKPC